MLYKKVSKYNSFHGAFYLQIGQSHILISKIILIKSDLNHNYLNYNNYKQDNVINQSIQDDHI